MLKHLWTALSSCCSYLWSCLTPDVVDEGVPVPREPVMVLVSKRELEELRADAAESQRNADLLDESREECTALGAKNAHLQTLLENQTALRLQVQKEYDAHLQKIVEHLVSLSVQCGIWGRMDVHAKGQEGGT